MDRGKPGATQTAPATPRTPAAKEEFEGIVRNGVIELLDGMVPDGTRVQIRVRR